MVYNVGGGSYAPKPTASVNTSTTTTNLDTPVSYNVAITSPYTGSSSSLDATGGNSVIAVILPLLSQIMQLLTTLMDSGSGAFSNSLEIGNTGNTGSTKSTSETTPTQSTGNVNADQQQFLELINDFRAKNGLPPVTLNDQLNQTARDYSKALDESGQFTHELNGTQFGDRIREHGYNLGTGTENIAKGQQSVEEAFQSWVDSPGHRANLLNPDIKEIGLGESNHVWSQVGAAPA